LLYTGFKVDTARRRGTHHEAEQASVIKLFAQLVLNDITLTA
jgi:hypothetical protein